MPDILIRGMEMPKSCAKCDLFGEYGCPFIGAVGYALTQGQRNEDCPLIELPPHGDLIDRDAILNAEKTKPIAKMMMFGGAYVIDLDVVRDAPVVVQAERSDTDA